MGINGENIFLEEVDYCRFLDRFYKYCYQTFETFTYCLMCNHFHCLVRIRTADEQRRAFKEINLHQRGKRRKFIIQSASQQLSNHCNSHAQYFNRKYKRTGNLFERPFKRIPVENPEYFQRILCYIHWNPERHGAVNDFRLYSFSSYQSFFSGGESWFNRSEVMERLQGMTAFRAAHDEIYTYWEPDDGIMAGLIDFQD